MRAKLRDVAGVPIVHLNRTVMVLEPPSDATLEAKRQVSAYTSYFGSTVDDYLGRRESSPSFSPRA